MRRVMVADVVCLAEVLAALPQGLRRQVVEKIVARADLADRYRKRFAQQHAFGDGTLSGAIDPAWPRGQVEPLFGFAIAGVLLIQARRARRLDG